MSTVPGHDAWRDAGLTEPADDVVNLVEEVDERGSAVPDRAADAAEEYRPHTPRPDLDGEADEADVVEQASAVPGEPDDYA
ncbi:hypothetical protein [Oerskovia flava]|uniref:hypothetical protein n=1 Tax=Oerskovia flava TaxID=2986422 RepID=UPI00223FD522|nr:hypothetical protein [Oerskovia sp. JB1-3-2]